MINKFRKTKFVNCAILLYPYKLSSESKYTNEVSIFAFRHKFQTQY